MLGGLFTVEGDGGGLRQAQPVGRLEAWRLAQGELGEVLGRLVGLAELERFVVVNVDVAELGGEPHLSDAAVGLGPVQALNVSCACDVAYPSRNRACLAACLLFGLFAGGVEVFEDGFHCAVVCGRVCLYTSWPGVVSSVDFKSTCHLGCIRKVL